MDIIEACMLSKDDTFKLENDATIYVMLGWNYHLMMPIVAPVDNKKEFRFLYPFRKVYVNKFYNH